MKKGQIQLNFGVLFSIFLIIVFVFFAFKVIGFFLDLNQCAETGDFFSDLQSSIDKARISSSTLQEFEIDLGSSVEKICFVDLNSSITGSTSAPDQWSAGDNMFIVYKKEGCKQLSNKQIVGINITKIIESENPKCFDNGDSIQIKKTVYSRLVELG